MSPGDRIKDVLQILEKRRDFFYFLLATDVWNRVADKDSSRLGLGLVKQPSSIVGNTFAKDDTNVVKRVLVNRGPNVVPDVPIKSSQARFAIDQAQLEELLTWIDAWNCTSKHEDTLELRQPNTCTWLTETTEYTTWRNTGNSFLWLNGKPGSGKSVLASSVINDIKNTLSEGELLAFFYCDFRNERSTASTEVMRSLLSQLLRGFGDYGVDPGDILSYLAEEKRRKGSILANAKRLATLVSRAAKQFVRQPLMVVDALDECNDIDNLLNGLVLLSKGGIKLLVVSRQLQVIKDGFSGLRRLSLESMSNEVSADINLHVAKEVDSHRRLRIVDALLKEEISQVLCKKADGMFRWIECQLITLKRCLTALDIREALESLPIGLEATYDRIFLAMRNEDKEGILTRRALVWLIAALKPLRLREIVEALSIDIDRRVLNRDVGPVHGSALLDSLGSLVTHDEETDIVSLSHFSVKEYLLTRHSHDIDQRSAGAQLARQCISYIAACLKMEHGAAEDLHPLLDYALSYGFRHLFHVYPNKAILDAIVTLDWDIQQHPSMWKLMLASDDRDYHLPDLKQDFVLYILVRYAPESLLRLFLGRSPLQGKEGTNPLVYASSAFKLDYARILLSYGARLDYPGRFTRDYELGPATGLPIEAAVRDGNRELVDLFIAEGSPVPHRLLSTAFLEKGVSISPHVVARLTQTDEFVEWATEMGGKTLLLGVLHRKKYSEDHTPTGEDVLVMIRKLKQIVCDLTGYNSFIKDLFRQAVHAGHVPTIEYFLTEFEVSLPPDILFSLPPWPFGCSSAPAICCLLHNGANVHFLLRDESTVLHHFIERCRTEDDCLEATKVLCNAGCDPSACNLRGKAPIHSAASRGFTSVAKHLLSVHVPLPPDILLSWSYDYPSESLKATRILFKVGADVSAVAPNGDTLLHLALGSQSIIPCGDYLDGARILVAAGCNPSVPNSLGQTPVELAVTSGQVPVVKYLLSTLDGPLPPNLLQFATSYFPDNIPMIRFLLANGADAPVTSSDVHKALHRAVMAGSDWNDNRCLQVAEILAYSGCAQPYTCDCAGEPLFHVVVHHRCSKVLENLISSGVPLPSDVLLAPCYEDKDLGMVQLLVENGANARATGFNGDTPLHNAVKFPGPERALEFSEILVVAGGDPCAINSSHRTPVHEAVDRGYLAVVSYLLSLHVPLPPDILLTTAKSYEDITPKVRFLIDNGAVSCAVTTNGDNALHLALAGGDEGDRLEAIKILIGAGCDMHAHNSAGETPLFVAAKAGHIAVVEYLLSQGEPLPCDILLAAASCRSSDKAMSTIRSLAGMGLDVTYAYVHAVAPNGDTCLHRAAAVYDPRLVRVFINLGCDPLLRNLAGETPLHIAARHGHISVVKYLLSKAVPLPSGVLLFAVSGDWYSLSMSAMIRLLVREDADLDAISDNGDTPLHVILQRDFSHSPDVKWEVIQILLNSGCNPYRRNQDGQTPVDLAETKGPFFLRNFMRLVKNAQNVPKPK